MAESAARIEALTRLQQRWGAGIIRRGAELGDAGLRVAPVRATGVAAFDALLRSVWPAMRKMQRRDEKYRAARAAAFTTDAGRRYLRELSIDELPGLTTPETTAVMLALCEALGMKIHFVAPAFGFQKNMPYPDNDALRGLITRQWEVCRRFGASIGFHSGSGKSAENYRVMGEVTGGRLEIKTSGRYTYEMGVALAKSQKTPMDYASGGNGSQHHLTMERLKQRMTRRQPFVPPAQPAPDAGPGPTG